MDGFLAKSEPGDVSNVPERACCAVGQPADPTVRGFQVQKLIEG